MHENEEQLAHRPPRTARRRKMRNRSPTSSNCCWTGRDLRLSCLNVRSGAAARR